MTGRAFHSIYRELIEDNPLAIRAVLKVLHVEFTDAAQEIARHNGESLRFEEGAGAVLRQRTGLPAVHAGS